MTTERSLAERLSSIEAKVDGVHARLDKMNGTNEKQWIEIGAIKLESARHEQCLDNIERKFDSLPDTGKAIRQWSMLLGVLLTALALFLKFM